ncbi:MAG: hypothetical protein MR425_08070 [Lachnospiraceae bacterium]|nr:hypothetical protein [Lachnospiraceae bacterium]
MMKKRYSMTLLVLMLLFLSGCATKYPDKDTVYIQKNGKISEATVASFDKDYYNEDELKSFIEDAIASYEETDDAGKVSMKDFKVEDQTAKLMMAYEDGDTYSAFNDREFFAGTVVQAIAAGYQFDADFVEVTDGVMAKDTDSTESLTEESTEAGSYQTVSASAFTAEDDYRVVILNEDTDVEVKGKISYVSAKGVTVTGKNTATVTTLNQGVSYIVYK